MNHIVSSSCNMVQPELILKFALLGGESVGKTTFVKYFAEHPFPMEHIQTIGVDVTVVPRGVLAGRQVYLHFFDVSSAEQHDVNSPSLQLALQEASGIFLLFDATEYSSFKEIDEINSILKYLYSCNNNFNKSPPPMILLAHKADLQSKNRRSLLTTQDILQFVDNNNMVGYRWTSLQNRQSVNDAVQALIEAALLPKESQNNNGNGGNNTDSSKGVIENLLQNTYSWPNMSETGGIKNRINTQLIRSSTTLLNINNHNNNDIANDDIEAICKTLKLKKKELLLLMDNISKNHSINNLNKSVEEIHIELELIDSCIKIYDESQTDDDGNMYHANDEELQKNEKIDEFMTISKYLLSQGPILGT